MGIGVKGRVGVLVGVRVTVWVRVEGFELGLGLGFGDMG